MRYVVSESGSLTVVVALPSAPVVVEPSDVYGVDPQLVEALAFAWLARQAILELPGNLPTVTGAAGARVLGAVYPR